MRLLLALLVLLLLAALAFGRSGGGGASGKWDEAGSGPIAGFFVRTDCDTLSNPARGATVCFDTTSNKILVYSAAGWLEMK